MAFNSNSVNQPKEIYDRKLKLKHGFHYELKPKQISILEKIINRVNCAGVFPTGYGKSVCFTLVPLILDEIHTSVKHTCIVISPLKSLMIDQCRQNAVQGIKAAVIQGGDTNDEDLVSGIKNGIYSIVYVSPEVLMVDMWREILLESDVYKAQVCLIAVDEAHVLETWGENFRPTFKNINELRSHFPTVPFLLLTATCTKKILKRLTDQLHLPELHLETLNPDRPNIFLKWNYRCGNDPMEELSWLISDLKVKGVNMGKTLVYVRSISQGSIIFRDFIGRLRQDAFLDSKKSFTNSFIAFFHAGLNQEEQEHVVHELPKSSSNIRLLICTVAFGMGINIPDIRRVIHWGACDSLMEYWQEVGRAGRDGKPSEAVHYITGNSLISVQEDTKNVYKSVGDNKCIRHAVLSTFIGNETSFRGNVCKCSCCSNCKATCTTH